MAASTSTSTSTSTSSSWLRRIAVNTLRAGKLPQHVAFIMDGNRRYARKANVERARGHEIGFEKLEETLVWCMDLGIKVVTVYAFSIENFKRDASEVDALMELAKKKFNKLIQEDDLIQKHSVCIRVLGDTSLLRPDVLETMQRAVDLSCDNTRAILNVCFPYTARHEITRAVRLAANGVEAGLLHSNDVDEWLLQQILFTAPDCGDPEMLVRTSGEVRLSDFLLWQTTHSLLSFMSVFWPEFGLRHLFVALLEYQVAAKCGKLILHTPFRRQCASDDRISSSKRVQRFLLNEIAAGNVLPSAGASL